MQTQGVLDRIEDGRYGVLLLENIKKEVVLDIEDFPAGSEEGDWFDITLDGEDIESLTFNKKTTDERKKTVQSKLSKLKKKKGSKFKK